MYFSAVVVTIFTVAANVTFATDPCLSSKQINKIENRGTNCIAPSSSLICDRPGFEVGWYHAIVNREYLDIPTHAPQPFACGTESPIWINGSNPSVSDGIANVTACVRGFKQEDTCVNSFQIQVKNCNGSYVYHLSYVDYCYWGYCFGNHTCTDMLLPVTSTATTSIQTLPPSDPCIYAETLHLLGQRGTQCGAADVTRLLCDRTLKAQWYMAINDNMFHDMPTRCVKPASCGTEEPIWLNGSLPSFTDGAVLRKACVRGLKPEECCKTTIDIVIRNCFTYNVYFLPYTEFCDQAFCFGNTECDKEDIQDGGNSPLVQTSHSVHYIITGCFVGVPLLIVLLVVVLIYMYSHLVNTKRMRIGHSDIAMPQSNNQAAFKESHFK